MAFGYDMPDAAAIRKMVSEVLASPEHGDLLQARCADAEASEIVAKARSVFVRGHPRSWWLSPRFPHESHLYAAGDGVEHLLKHVPSVDSRYWLILETEDDFKPVLNVTPADAQRLLRNLPFIEYYLVNHALDWLLIENDHDEILVYRAPIVGPNEQR